MIPESVTKVAYEQISAIVDYMAKYARNSETVKFNFETASVTIQF